MKVKHLNIDLILIIIMSIAINFKSFLMGSASNLLNIVITIGYIIFWFAYIWISKENKRNLVFSIIWSLLTFVCAAFTLAVNIKTDLIVDFIIPFSIIFLTPLYGIEALFDESWALKVSIICIIISLTWFTMSLIFLKGKKQRFNN